MQVKHDSTGAEVLSDADKKTIDGYRAEILATRKELRDVQRALRENIERLQAMITFTLMPPIGLAESVYASRSDIVMAPARLETSRQTELFPRSNVAAIGVSG